MTALQSFRLSRGTARGEYSQQRISMQMVRQAICKFNSSSRFNIALNGEGVKLACEIKTRA
jgi:hypothetical protein